MRREEREFIYEENKDDEATLLTFFGAIVGNQIRDTWVFVNLSP